MAVGSLDLSISDVSGIIAVGIAVVQILIPIALPIILLRFLKHSPPTLSASTWSVLARELQSSYWPTLLSTDSAATPGLYAVSVVSWLKTGAKVLTAVAAVVTPLGLYQDIVPRAQKSAQFHYIEDTSVFGKNTPPRDADTRFSRLCGGFAPIVCPNSQGNLTAYTNATGQFVDVEQYNTDIPQRVTEAFQSGLSDMEASVSSIFDIESRYTTSSQTIDRKNAINHGKGYPLSQLRPIRSLIADRGYQLVEGLVVDLEAGGIGFRNHSAPPWQLWGSEWTEDLLFIEPETQCVNLNLTLDYDVPTSANDPGGLENLVLTDQGGFANLPTNFSPLEGTTTHSQSDPELVQRAFTAAWVNNLMSMIFLNITSPGNYGQSGEGVLTSADSYPGRTFPLMRNGTTEHSFGFISNTGLQSSGLYGGYLEGTDYVFTGGNSTIHDNSSSSSFDNFTKPQPALIQNPFHIDDQNFTAAGTLCARTSIRDYANISNIAVSCGLVYGVAQRRTPGDSMTFVEPGSNWSIPLYSCATGVKATVKSVSFKFNGTDDLNGLKVVGIRGKTYPDNHSMPLWGVENSGMLLNDIQPLWGLVSPKSAGQLGLSTVRQEHLWLPGTTGGDVFSTDPYYQNLPGVGFYKTALAGTYGVAAGSIGFFDYSGASDMPILRQWQQLSRTSDGTSQILDLIWTDIAANYVLGTRSMATSSAGGNSTNEPDTSTNNVSVIFYGHKIRFHILYGIPAFLTLAMTLLSQCYCMGQGPVEWLNS